MISGTTRLLGVIGDPVAHSRSPRMQNAALQQMGLDWGYVPLHVTADQLEAALDGRAKIMFYLARPGRENVENVEVCRQLGKLLRNTTQYASLMVANHNDTIVTARGAFL